uniref:Uncharacterized protein n=1 Tax=Anguilla anguilla TaxID=7936 RepID=A0A0E9U464_ANGAN
MGILLEGFWFLTSGWKHTPEVRLLCHGSPRGAECS